MNIQTLTDCNIRGEVRRIIYQGEDGVYTVIKLIDQSKHEQTVCGPLGEISEGQTIELHGKWEKHERYGYQFRAKSFKIILPSTPDGIKRFLSSGIIAGIGEKTADLIVEYFKENTIDILENSTVRLLEVPGIGRKKAQSIIDGWKSSSSKRDGMIFLQGLGITPAYCAKLYKRYGDNAPEIVKKNPYQLAQDVNGIGFLRADAIAMSLGFEKNCIERLCAGVAYAINKFIESGNVCIPKELLIQEGGKLLDVPSELVVAGIDRAIERNLLKDINGDIYSSYLASVELNLPQIIEKIIRVKNFKSSIMGKYQIDPHGRFSQGQFEAVKKVTENSFTIITGGPGVGKTTVVGEIVRLALMAKLRIQLAAPTGRAAKRLGESTKLPAKTIHRLLHIDPTNGKFSYDQNNPLECDLLIVDEVSMLDISLAYSLLRAVRPACSVVFVGDADQLPSVGPGTVLKSLIESNIFTVVHLHEVFRQGADSNIIVNAHRVNQGSLPLIDNNNKELSDFYWIEQDDPEKVLNLIEKLTTERIPERFKFNPRDDIQILSPMNNGVCGTININEHLSLRLNPGERPHFKYGEKVIKLGDKVMQTSNNYDKNVFNGDMGFVWKITPKEKKFSILFDNERMIEYAMEECDQITRAYAITVHKSQGCEFPVVIIPMLNQHYMMLQRNLLYTAMTRAKKLLVLIGGKKSIRMAVENSRQDLRYTNLTKLLKRL